MKKVLVTGCNGQLGRAIQKEYAGDVTFILTDVAEREGITSLDITDIDAVMSLVLNEKPDVIINCAALTNVDGCEKMWDLAYKINAIGPRNLAIAATAVGAKLVHVSTDYVFSGTNCRPYVETDATRPVSAYGRTKLAGEEILQEVCPDAVIIRTAWLYSEFGNNFVKTVLRLGKERDELGFVFDQIGTPTYAGDLAAAILTVVDSGERDAFVPGIYHFSDEGVCSWYDFTVKILEVAGIECRVRPIETKDYPTKAVRPPYSVLNKKKIKETYGIVIPHWEESLRVCMEKL